MVSRTVSAYKKKGIQLIEKEDLMVANDSMKQVVKRTRLIANQSGCVLIEGESGTGKTLLAKKLHLMSPRREEPFVEVGCGELAPSMMESALFGHSRDAYTGAQTQQNGVFFDADRGTLVLNDIDRLPVEYQARFLRFLDDHTFCRLGEPGKPIVVDVRVVATTNKNLSQFGKQNLFLHDLYYRLKRWRIRIPPLRNRPEDIALIAQSVLTDYCKRNGLGAFHFSDDALLLLKALSWPDNIRGLRNAVENVALFAGNGGRAISINEVADILFDPDYGVIDDDDYQFKPSCAKYLKSVLDMTGWNIKLAGKITGFSRTTIYKRIEENNWKK